MLVINNDPINNCTMVNVIHGYLPRLSRQKKRHTQCDEKKMIQSSLRSHLPQTDFEISAAP